MFSKECLESENILNYADDIFFIVAVDRNIFVRNHLIHVDGLPLECIEEDSFLVVAILKIWVNMEMKII